MESRLGMFGTVIALVIIGAIPAILFVRSIQNTLKEIKPVNRKMSIPFVWLMLVPVLDLVIQFVVVIKLSASIEQELKERGISYRGKPTLIAGIIFCILPYFSFYPPFEKYTKYLWFISFFFYWAQVVEYKRKLIDTKPSIQ
jgi:hypothetical protein